jgi:diguanylate cyclase (GGDEF)-like protein
MESTSDGKELRILIVDDDIVDREMVKRLLNKSYQKFIIDEAKDVDEGLSLYDENRHDIVLLDYRMPKRDGIEMIIELRTHIRDFGSAIVMMSSAEDNKLAINCIEAGAQDFIPKSEITTHRLFNALVHAKTRFELEQELRKSYLQSKDLAERDSLTGLANRFVFEENLQLAVANNPRNEFKLGLILFDIDNFKIINDIHGHDIGDQVLKEVSSRVSACLRDEELFSRLGGDEFAIVVANLKDSYQMSKIANRIVNSLKKPITTEHIDLNIEISIGIALHPDNSLDSKELVKCTDIAMYRAKSIRGNSISFFYSEMQDDFLRRYEIEKTLAESISDNLLALYYQPIIDPSDKSLTGFEALLRLKTTSQKKFLPDEFIPIAEHSGKIVEIGIWVIKTSLAQFKKWQKKHPNDLTISINLSPVQLDSDSLIETIKSAIDDNNIEPSAIEFEITETAFINPNKNIIERIQGIRELGCYIALDDFGTGYSSISHLQLFPITTIKLDKSIMPSGPDDLNSIKLVEALVSMANILGLGIVAEGIETEFQLSVINKHNLNRAQGYLFEKPCTALNIDQEYF